MTISRRNGVVALITVVLIALFLFTAGVILGVQGNTAVSNGQFASQSDKAEALAEAGIEDAAIKLGRNASYSGAYTLTETDGTAAVSVTAGSPVIVNATGTVIVGTETVQRSIQARVTLNGDGQITGITKTDQ